MSSQEIIIDEYKFSDFVTMDRDTVRFKATKPNSFDVTEDDGKYLTDTLKNTLGKWENLIKTGLQVFSEIGIIRIDQATTQNYEKPFGIELYGITATLDNYNKCLWVFISLTREEHSKREKKANINPLIQIEEITNQINNIPKWKTLKKTTTIIREELL